MNFAKTCYGLVLAILFAPQVLATDMDQGILRIGTIFPLTGPQYLYGQEALAGVELALGRLAESDPELASRIRIVKGDDQGKPSEAGKIAEQLIVKDHASLIIGSITSPVSLEIAKVAQRLQRPHIIPATTAIGLTSIGEFIFRTCIVDGNQGHNLALFAQSSLSARTAALLINKDHPYATEMGHRFVSTFNTSGGKVVSQEFYDNSAKSFKVALKAIADSKPDILVVPARTQEARSIIKEMNEMGLAIPILGGEGWDDPGIGKQIAKQPNRPIYYATEFFADAPMQSVSEFVDRFKAKVRRIPSPLAAMTYDATLAAIEAYRSARTPDALSLTKSLAKLKDIQVITGTMSMTESRNADKPSIVMELNSKGTRYKTSVSPIALPPVSVAPSVKDAG